MKNLACTLLLIGLVVTFAEVTGAQVSKPENSPVFGTADQAAYLDLAKLLGTVEQGGNDVYNSYKSKLLPKSFFQKYKADSWACWSGSILREGVVAYCFPYLMIGQYGTLQYQKEPMYLPITSRYPGVYVWYEPDKNSYYIWSNEYSSSFALGPFRGEPLSALTKAIIPTKGKREFPNVELQVVAQNWTFPEMPEPKNTGQGDTNFYPYNEELQKYENLTSRIRLTNKGKNIIYYLAHLYYPDPDGFLLTKSESGPGWNRRSFPFRFALGRAGTRWLPLAPGGEIEFEIKFYSIIESSYQYVVVLNDEPKYWDEVETPISIPAMSRRKPKQQFTITRKGK